mmetsp:Transcript_30126/g.52953  ORF Transcript_30126/g.52953 Transcript_30126/m.52953 type:complete len:100 (+) Transcript_30126:140-439(+)
MLQKVATHDGVIIRRTTPTVDLGSGLTATSICAGQHHTCVILNMGQVKCWGRNLYGQLGVGNNASRGNGLNEMGDDLPAVDLPVGTSRTATAIFYPAEI